jgi:hypothetical protein
MKAYQIQDREAGNVIDTDLTYNQAIQKLRHYEDIDMVNGNFTPYFYEIVEMESTNQSENMETNYTKGEWIAKGGQIYPQETGETLALIPYFDAENKEQQANQKLLAAAPELLEVLQELIKLHPYAKGIDKAQQAINKATQ